MFEKIHSQTTRSLLENGVDPTDPGHEDVDGSLLIKYGSLLISALSPFAEEILAEQTTAEPVSRYRKLWSFF